MFFPQYFADWEHSMVTIDKASLLDIIELTAWDYQVPRTLNPECTFVIHNLVIQVHSKVLQLTQVKARITKLEVQTHTFSQHFTFIIHTKECNFYKL